MKIFIFRAFCPALFGASCRRFSCKFSRKMVLVTCPCAFPLRRHAQNLRRGFCLILVCRIWHENSISTFISTAQARTNRCPGLGLRHFTLHILAFTSSCDLSMCIPTAQARRKRLSRSWPAAFYRVFLPWIVIFIMSMCMSTAQAASKELSRSWPFSLRFCRSFRLHSWRAVICEDFDRGLTEILVGGCCAHPDDILSLVLAWSCTWYARHILCVDMGQSSAKTPMLTRTFTWWQWFTLGGSHSRCPCKNFPALNGPRFGI